MIKHITLLIPILVILGCNNLPPVTEDVEHLFGNWIHEKIEYSNSTVNVSPTTIYSFQNNFLFISNNLSNYSGSIMTISGTSTNTLNTRWSVDFKDNNLYLTVSNTNFIYTINLVAIDSTNVNYIWLMNGRYTVANQTVMFFISNRILKYILKKQ